MSHAPDDANLQAASARCLRQLGEHAEARRILEAILQRQPDQFAAVLGMAELLRSGGEPAAAIPFYRRAVADDHQQALLLSATLLTLAAAGRAIAPAHLPPDAGVGHLRIAIA
ncbi:tetratricopeptide repeat protein [Synechococcus sp. BA-124 BA4]|uniref:tetratricopeptide repeat protein n=1 Tax=Synechococcus sp. BA-124 BA4 TaxID=3110251 RepID=UPI003A4C75A7